MARLFNLLGGNKQWQQIMNTQRYSNKIHSEMLMLVTISTMFDSIGTVMSGEGNSLHRWQIYFWIQHIRNVTQRDMLDA